MRRREFIAVAAATASLALANRIRAQADPQRMGKKRIAIVHPSETLEALTINGRRAYKAFFSQLNKLGYIEGQNLIVQRYSALGRIGRYQDIARAAVAAQPDLIVCIGSPLALRLTRETTTIPILTTSADPVVAGLITNMARPDRNITGVSVDAGIELWGKRLQLLHEVVGGRLTKARLLFASTFWKEVAATVGEAAQRAGTSISAVLLGESIDQAAYQQVFGEMIHDRVNGLIIFDATEHLTNRLLIIDLAAKYQLPTIYPFRDFVESGGLLSYGVDGAEVLRLLADMTDQILRGAKPGDIPFFQQTKFELLLNRKTAASLRLEFPPTLLAAADEVIE